jgi:NAD(P)-dependent dehydrogenase (short-subunit alcohol dehydrogenase family)
MDLQLTDRVAFVAGSSKGIGRAIATTLLSEGCRVCITGRDSVALDDATQQLRAEFGDKIFSIPGDLTTRQLSMKPSPPFIGTGVLRTSSSPMWVAAGANRAGN